MASTHAGAQAGAATRAKIIRNGMDLFARQGFHRTTLAQVANAAGTTRPGLIYHFGSKADLLAAVLDERTRQTLSEADGVEIDAGADLTQLDLTDVDLAYALQIVDRIAARNAGQRGLVQLAHVCALESVGGVPVAAAWARERHRRIRAMIATATRNSIERGSVPADTQPEQIAALLIAAFEGMENQWLVDEDFDMVAGVHAMTALLRRDLGLA